MRNEQNGKMNKLVMMDRDPNPKQPDLVELIRRVAMDDDLWESSVAVYAMLATSGPMTLEQLSEIRIDGIGEVSTGVTDLLDRGFIEKMSDNKLRIIEVK